MGIVHFIFPTMTGRFPISLYGVGAPATPTLLYVIAKSLNFGRYEGGRCWDTAIHNEQVLLGEIKQGDLVCVTATVSGYPAAISLLAQARKKGATTAIGGPWVSARSAEIAAHRPWIDYVVRGEGERVLRAILRGVARRGLIYGRSFPMVKHRELDFSGWSDDDLHLYNKNYNQMIASGEYGPPPQVIPAFVFYQSIRGCIQRPRCAFCGVRLGEKLNWRTADQFHADVEAIVSQYAEINSRIHIFDTSDSFASVLGRFHGKYRGHEGVTFTVFSRVDEVNPQSAEDLRRLGVTKVSLGIESGSDAALAQMGKRTTAEQNKNAVRLLGEAGIQVYMNFMYGLPNETVENLERTVDHCLGLCSTGNVYRAKGRITTPLPGSRWFKELVHDHPEVDNGSDWLSPQELGLAWLKYRTHVTPEDIQRVNARFTSGASRLGVTYSSETAVWFG